MNDGAMNDGAMNDGAMKRYTATVASDKVYVLAEGPLWDPVRNRVLWVDINGHHVLSGELQSEIQREPHSERPGVVRIVETARLTFSETVGAVVCSADGDLLVAGATAPIRIPADATAGTTADSDTTVPRLVPPGTESRLNDGACDPAGRFLVGTLALDDRKNEEKLFRIEASGEVTVLDDELGLSNGLAWSPDGRWFYSIDTAPGLIWIRSYDSASGQHGERRQFLHIDDGHPDGMCVDAEGNLWVAIWGAGEVRCFSPDAELLAVVDVPAPNTSCVAFVGPNLDTLLITTASEQLSDGQISQYPDSGRLFTVSVGTVGLPTPYWSDPDRPGSNPSDR